MRLIDALAPLLLLSAASSADGRNTKIYSVASIERSGTDDDNSNNSSSKNVQHLAERRTQGTTLRHLLKKLSFVGEDEKKEEVGGAALVLPSLRGMMTSQMTSVKTGDNQQQHRSLQASNAISCPSEPGLVAQLNTHHAGGAITLASVGSMGHLCTLTKVSVQFDEVEFVKINQVFGEVHVDSIIPLARSYDDKNWSNAAGEIPAVMLSTGWDCFEESGGGGRNYCTTVLPPLEKEDEMYVLSSYEHTLPPRDVVSRFLSQTTFGVTTEELDDVRWIGGGEGGE